MTNTFVATALAVTLAVSVAAAQQSSEPETASTPRLTVRLHEMATGARTAQGGLTELAGFPGYYVYVPQQCVGTQRAPLIVVLHGGGRSAKMEIAKLSPLADKYGVIVLLPNASNSGHWEMIDGMAHSEKAETGLRVLNLPMHDVRNIDSAMKLVLRTHAIDPDRVALLGFSDGGSSSLLLGRSNLDVFNRIAALSALIPFDGVGPQNAKTQFFLSGGIAEDMVAQTLKMAQVLRRQGHPVVTLLGLREHVDRVVDEDFVWRWLMQSWADPGITTRVSMPADSDPVLTVEAMNKMTAFWNRFKDEPPLVLLTGRMEHQEQLWLALGSEPVSVITTDMPALAAAYPSVAADLQAAGLTAQQEAAYRAAILRVGFARAGGIIPSETTVPTSLGINIPFDPIEPTSVFGKNIVFRKEHDAEFNALGRTGMWTIQ